MGFSADWLALREPADSAARDEGLARRAAAAAGPAPRVVDLGCGTGATFRALAPLLPEGARWCLVDADPQLLAAAGAAAGDRAELRAADLGAVEALPLDDATLVTASALLDLVSEAWLGELVRRLRVPFYAALSYCGEMSWTPEDPCEDRIAAAFDRHQRRDKGLGPALGPAAADRAVLRLREAGFAVATAPSPWVLDADAVALQRALVDGIAAAAAETGAAEAPRWAARRREAAGRCRIGHLDLLALPPGHRISRARR